MRSPLLGHRRLPAAFYDAFADADAQPDFTDGKRRPGG